jgi:two-component sensor histidine kinase
MHRLVSASTLAIWLGLAGCGGTEEQELPADERLAAASCLAEVRTVLTEAESTGSEAERAEVLEQGLGRMTGPAAALCRRELRLELADLYERLGRTDRLAPTCEALLAPDVELDPERSARIKLKLAKAYFDVGLPRAFDLAKDVFRYYEAMNVRSDRMLEATELLVNTYDLTGEMAECRSLLLEALRKAESEGDIRWTCDLLGRIGGLDVREGRAQDAIDRYTRSLDAMDRFFLKGMLRDTLVRRIVERDRETPHGVARTSDTITELLTEGHYLRMRHTALKGAGDALNAAGMTDSAASTYEAALRLGQASFLPGLVQPLAELGVLRLMQGRAEEAVRLGEEARRTAERDHDPQRVQQAAGLLYRAFKARGDMTAALRMFEMADAYADSLNNEAFRMGLLKNQVTYEVRDDSLRMSLAIVQGQRDADLARSEARADRNRLIIVGIASMAVLAAGVLLFRADRKRRQERFEKDAALLETQALRSQMNPHFIFNALNSINAFVQSNDPDMASSYLSKFARVMRLVLENSRHAEVPLASDLEALRGYLDLERKRSRDKFDYAIEIDPALDPEEVLVPPLVVQPFVENAIWHGMAGKEDKGLITLRVEGHGEQLLWVIEDNGVGRQARKADAPPEAQVNTAGVKKTSLGTAITRARLDLVQKQYGGRAGWRYVDRTTGTRVEVDMPLRLG